MTTAAQALLQEDPYAFCIAWFAIRTFNREDRTVTFFFDDGSQQTFQIHYTPITSDAESTAPVTDEQGAVRKDRASMFEVHASEFKAGSEKPKECADVLCMLPAQPGRNHCQWHYDGTDEDLQKVKAISDSRVDGS